MRIPGTVLVVEDEVIIRIDVADHLRDCGFQVLEAGNADDAVEMLKSHAAIHVVFTDVQMPGSMDGLGLAQWIRRERTDVKVIVTSGMGAAMNAARQLCRAGEFFPKPYDPRAVERRIRQILAG